MLRRILVLLLLAMMPLAMVSDCDISHGHGWSYDDCSWWDSYWYHDWWYPDTYYYDEPYFGGWYDTPMVELGYYW